MRQTNRLGGWRKRAAHALTLVASVVALSGCDDLLEVELPHLLTDDAIQGAATAETQVISAMALFECGISTFAWVGLGHEDVFESVAGVAGSAHIFRADPVAGGCDDNSQDQSWFDQVMGARALISTDPAKLVASEGRGQGVYDKLNDGTFNLGQAGERLSAIAAIYMAATLQHFGEFYCEGALDGSDLINPGTFLQLAEDWITNRALTHINNFGDFAMPNNASASARNMATAMRAQIRWARGDLAGAAADALTVLNANGTFTAYVTREAGEERRNKIYHAGNSAGFSGMYGVNDWWDGPNRAPNPATGQTWPSVIPHTGYIFLGVMPDGRTLEAGNIPVRWAAERRDPAENPVSLANGAVPDTRVAHIFKSIQGPEKREVPNRWTSDDADIPLVSWRELRLIRAQWENQTNNNQTAAIGHVNALRTAANLPTVSGAYLATLTNGTNDQTEVRHLILEERRRSFYTEIGRYWSTKIQNPDVLWFPRFQGQTPFQGYPLLGGVRLQFANDEYQLNPRFQALGGLAARGSGCAAAVAPSIQ